MKTDVNGDSVFRYETLDLNWAFSGTNSGSVTYQVTRLTDPGLMMKSLRFAEIFLKNSQQALYPYALWLTEKCYQLSSAGVEQKNAQAVCLCVFVCPGLEERRLHLDKGAVNWVL